MNKQRGNERESSEAMNDNEPIGSVPRQNDVMFGAGNHERNTSVSDAGTAFPETGLSDTPSNDIRSDLASDDL